MQVNDELGLKDQATESATLASLIKQSQSSTSAFAAHSQKAFDDLSPEGGCQPVDTPSLPSKQVNPVSHKLGEVAKLRLWKLQHRLAV